MHAFQKSRILTSLKIGPASALAVNQWIYSQLVKKGLNAIPLMITSNDYRMELFNGEVGILLTVSKEFSHRISENDMVYFASRKKLSALLLPSYELAFAMTVHKSQGSEFDEVLLLCPQGISTLSVTLFYSAVTRARRKLALRCA